MVDALTHTQSPEARNLAFWGTAKPSYLQPAAVWAGKFGPPGLQFIRPRATSAFFGDTDLTVATWVMPTDTAAFAEQCPYSQWNVNGEERKFYFLNNVAKNTIEFGIFKKPDNVTAKTQVAMRNGVWYRLVGVHEHGKEIRLYVDGQLLARQPHTFGIGTGEGARPQLPWLGNRSCGDTNYDANSYWRGLIGPTSYYTRVWTEQEVAWDYNGGSARRYCELGQRETASAAMHDALVAHWEMTEEDTGVGPYIPRRDASPGQHHLHPVAGGTHPRCAVGILQKTEAIEESDRVERWIDRSALGNHLTQGVNEQRPFWDANANVVSVEAGTSLACTTVAGLAGQELSVYLVSIIKAAHTTDPWLHLSGGGQATGLQLFRHQDRLVAETWIGGQRQELSFALSYPAERLIELHYGHGRLSLWESGSMKASTPAVGGFGQLTSLRLGPSQGLSELLIYDEAHQ